MADQPSEEPVAPAVPESEENPEDGRGKDPAPAETEQQEENIEISKQDTEPQAEQKQVIFSQLTFELKQTKHYIYVWHV